MDVYKIVTGRIIDALKKGCVPWKKPFTTGFPKNLLRKKEYRGINSILLGTAPYSLPWWVTQNQAKILGGAVKKKERKRGYPVVFWKFIDEVKFEDEEESKPVGRKIPFLRFYTVFNVAQCDGLDDKIPVETGKDNIPIERCAEIVTATGATIKDGNAAYYTPGIDEISIPAIQTFVSSEKYYSTLFHELTHWTGHNTRLARDEVVKTTIMFGSADYSKEELVAEMGAAFLSGVTGIAEETVQASASYIQSWLKRLEQNPKWVVLAAGQAQKATDYILSFSKSVEKPAEQEKEAA